MMGSKGPKISSLMMGESRGGFSITVGAMYLKSTTSSTMLVGFSGQNLPIMYHDELSTLPNESQEQVGLTIFSSRSPPYTILSDVLGSSKRLDSR